MIETTFTLPAAPAWATEHGADGGYIVHDRCVGSVPVVSGMVGEQRVDVRVGQTDRLDPATMTVTQGTPTVIVADVEIAADQLRPLAALLLEAADMIEGAPDRP